MCLLCQEVAKELIKPKTFWRNFRELIMIDDPHQKEVIKAIKKTSIEFQEKLSNLDLAKEDSDDS